MSMNSNLIARRCIDAVNPSWLLWVAIVGTLLSNGSSSSFAHGQEDIVITRRKNSQATFKRRGTIKEWKGFSITITTNVGEKEIENDAIVEVQTSWLPDLRGRIKVAGIGRFNSGN